MYWEIYIITDTLYSTINFNKITHVEFFKDNNFCSKITLKMKYLLALQVYYNWI